jgi:glycosyltransferase involved in cell wall biosynthesis
MRQFSVVIITKNEERNIRRCLESVKGITDDIVVFDSGSIDRTKSICAEYGVRFFQHDFQDFSDQKNLASREAKYDWILSIDSDEALSKELKMSLLELLKSDDTSYYMLNRLTNYCGSWVKYCGWFPDWKLRFYNKKDTEWRGSIHEELVSDNNLAIKKLSGVMYHYSYYTMEEHILQAEKFTKLKVEAKRLKKHSSGFVYSILSGIWKFISIYIIKLGFLDGVTGYRIAKISAHVAFRQFKYKNNVI